MVTLLSPGQIDSQVDSSQRQVRKNQNLHTDLRWVAKQIPKSARKLQKAVHFTHIVGQCIFITIDYLRLTCVDLCWVAKWLKICICLRPNLSSTKVNTSRRKWVAKRKAS